jgi:hypothetical protein
MDFQPKIVNFWLVLNLVDVDHIDYTLFICGQGLSKF